jgi:transposase
VLGIGERTGNTPLESQIFTLAKPYQAQIDLILTVPGIRDPMTAIRIIAEIGADMSVFESAKHLASWAGLAPQNNESAGKKKTTHIGKSGAYIKPLLVQIALAAGNFSILLQCLQTFLGNLNYQQSLVSINFDADH